MMNFDPNKYGPALAPLVAIDRCRSLGAGAPDRDARGSLESLSVKSAFAHAKVPDRDMATCCIAAVWLLYDQLDESHTISQGIDAPSGSFWHGIMHRREGDFSNAKYWLRHVGRHAVFDALGEAAAAIAAEYSGAPGAEELAAGTWDPYAFVDLCQSAACGEPSRAERGQPDAAPPAASSAESLCRAVQQAEWELLFDYCYRAAVGQ